MQAAREFRTAIRFDSLNRRVVFFAGTDTNHARDIKDKDLTVADFAGLRRLQRAGGAKSGGG